MLEALLSEGIVWTRDPDFGYEVVDVDHPANAELLEKVPREILQPQQWFSAHGRLSDYRRWVDHMREARRAFLTDWDVGETIVTEVCGPSAPTTDNADASTAPA